MPSISRIAIMIGGNRGGGGGLLPSVLAKALYYGKISDIVGGEMPNLVTGATDFITIGGSAGSYTFQVPNTAPYIAADTDYIWFKTDTTQRTTTEAELVGYDLPRTPVKYDSTTPYAIREILILKAGETLTTAEENNVRTEMKLSIWWSNVSSDYGETKGNRTGEQSIWTPESLYLAHDTFTDTDNVKLNAHTMDVGDGWTAPDDFIISSNKLTNVSIGGNYFATIDAETADVDISLDIKMPDVNYYYSSIALRISGTSPINMWLCNIARDGSGGSARVELRSFVAGTGTTRGTANITHANNTTFTLRVVASGDNIKVYWSDPLHPGLLIDVNNSLFNDKTVHGIYTYLTNTNYTKFEVDNFIIQ